MLIKHLLEAIPVKNRKPMSGKDVAGKLLAPLSRAKRACKSILLTQPLLYRGVNTTSFADAKYALPNEFTLYEFSGRTTPRNSATGINMIQSLLRIHPEWEKAGFPDRRLSVFCANQSDDASDFGQIGVVLPYDTIHTFGVTEDDLNLKKVHKNEKGEHHLIKFQNAAHTFLGGMSVFYTPIRAINGGDKILLQRLKAETGFELRSDDAFIKYAKNLELIKAIEKITFEWIEKVGDRKYEWTPADLRILDELYEAWKRSKDSNLIANRFSQFEYERMREVFLDEKPSEVFLHSMRPKTMGASVCDYNQMMNEIRTDGLREIWFEGPYLLIVNDQDEDMPGDGIKRFLTQDPTMQIILHEVAG